MWSGARRCVQAEEEVDEKQDELEKIAQPLPENGPDPAAEKKAAVPKSNSAAQLSDLRRKKQQNGGGAEASEGELTVKESRATGQHASLSQSWLPACILTVCCVTLAGR